MQNQQLPAANFDSMKHALLKAFRASLLLFASLLMSSGVYALTASVSGTLPSTLQECSGIDFNGGVHFWTHNDGYGDNNLYKVNMAGDIVQTVTVTNAVNYDWEDVTHDAARNYLFIGDFGNNACSRTNLSIYKLAYPHSSTGNATTAECIRFSYPDQRSIPSAWMNFDVESFVHYNGKLYLFTKTDGNAIGYTKIYSIPENAGTYVATLVDSFYTNDRTTSATLSPDQSSLVIISNSLIHLFRNWTGDNFFNGQHTQIPISGAWSQKEGVSFYSNNEIYLSDEDNGSGNHLYYVNLSPYIPSTTNSISEEVKAEVSIVPNPASSFVTFNTGNKSFRRSEIQLYDLTGRLVLSKIFENTLDEMKISVTDLREGIYIYKFIGDGAEVRTARLVVSR